MKPAYTVVVPVHNKLPHLDRAIQSIDAQAFKDIELIAVDDASSDGSTEKLRSLSDQREYMRLLTRSSPGPGGYAARNLAIHQARAEWIAFLDADDQWETSFLTTIDDLRRQFPHVEWCSTNYTNIESDGHSWESPYGERFSNAGPHLVDLRRYIAQTGKGRCPTWTSSTVVKKDTLLRVGLFPDDRCTRGGDADLWLRLSIQSDLAWSPAPSALYYRDAVNRVTAKTPPQHSHCIERTIEKFAVGFRPPRNPRHASRLAWLRLRNHYRKGFLERALRAGKLRPRNVMRISFKANPVYWIRLFALSLTPAPLLEAARSLIRRFRSPA